MCAKTLASLACTLAVGLIPAVGSAEPYQQEDWNDADAPEDGENYWAYWDEDYIVPDEPTWANYHHHPMNWSATGGVDNSGYVWTPLASLETEHDEVRAYWPAYLTDQITSHFEVEPREIHLGDTDTHIQLAVKDRGLTSEPADLKGGQLHFFVGQWWINVEEDPNDDQWIFFYNSNEPFRFDALEWTNNTVAVGSGTSDWPIISQSGVGNTNPLPPVSEAQQLFDSPQQWGIVVYDPKATVLAPPSGQLGFDNFAIVPEPAGLTLAIFAGLLLLGCLRKC